MAGRNEQGAAQGGEALTSRLLLVAALIILCFRVADLERQGYLLLTGTCGQPQGRLVEYGRCLREDNPRTSWWWNLFYGLKG